MRADDGVSPVARRLRRRGWRRGGTPPSAPLAVTLEPLPLTSANAASVTSEVTNAQSLYSGSGGASLFGVAVVPTSSDLISLGDVARSQLTIALRLKPTTPATGAVYEQTDPCESGTGTVTVRWNDADGNLDVSAGDTFRLIYNGCPSAGAVLDGASSVRFLSVTGNPLVAMSAWSVSMSVSFGSLTQTQGSDVWTMRGGMTVNQQTADGVSFTTGMSGNELTATEPAGAWTLRNFQYDETDGDNTTAYTWSQSGRLDSTIIGGQVSFETETITPFAGNGTNYPSSGVMMIRGKDNTSVKLRVIDSTYVDLEVDSDGDSVVDDTIHTTWAALGA